MTRQPSADRTLIRAAMNAPYLEREEEHQLAEKWKDYKDQEALNKLVSAHMRLVISIAARFKNFGLPMGDLIQEGHVGLLEAAARFEPEREVRFSTYATWWIRASIQDYILRNWSVVRGGTSSTQKALFFNLRRLRARLTKGGETVADPETYKNIAAAIGVSVKDVEVMDSRLSAPDSSLNAPVLESDSQGTSEKQDFLVCSNPTPDVVVSDDIDSERRANWLGEALQVLSDRELQIVKERRLSDMGATLESLGAKLGISKERVRQIESRALEKLRSHLMEHHPEAGRFV